MYRVSVASGRWMDTFETKVAPGMTTIQDKHVSLAVDYNLLPGDKESTGWNI